jgi:hypothetical protein
MLQTSTSTDVPTLRVRIDPEDLMAFFRFHSRHSRTHFIVKLLVAGTAFLVGFQIAFDVAKELSPAARVLAATAGALLFAALVYAIFQAVLARAGRRLIRENPRELGEFEYRLEEHGIAEIGPGHETKRRYSDLRQIHDAEKFVFVTTNAGQTFVLPKEKVLAGDLDAFADELRRRMANG